MHRENWTLKEEAETEEDEDYIDLGEDDSCEDNELVDGGDFIPKKEKLGDTGRHEYFGDIENNRRTKEVLDPRYSK